ncbi:endo-1,4-beta-xylanase 5-like [Salvia miltiorrhiza]|uniref:endo-1,4-beta-xylanase 5-like n=1 Tax=Salvia miltiorrhiza TaxID=226208 RepID=UPI0025AD35C5|nr:endo-1,4-beta-xylanase 5-like [Salvia miltiorrhiza]
MQFRAELRMQSRAEFQRLHRVKIRYMCVLVGPVRRARADAVQSRAQDAEQSRVSEAAQSEDPVHVPVGPVTRARAKTFKANLMTLVEEIWRQELKRPIGEGLTDQSSKVHRTMKYFQGATFVVLCALLISGCALAESDSSNYDYKANIRCMVEALDPQYEGGMVNDPTFSSDLDDWKVYGNANIEKRKSTKSDNYYLVAYNRSQPLDGFSQSFDLQKDLLYTFSAWLQVDQGEETILAYMVTPSGEHMAAGSVIAKSGCWSMLKGGFTAYQDMKADLIFKCPNTMIEVWIDNVSLKSFTKEEWRDQQQRSINKIRKREIKLMVMNEAGEALEGANINLIQTRPLFTIGSGTASSILDSKPYQDYFAARYTAATPHNEMKWYATELTQGHENYTVPDAMFSFFTQRGIAIRGHCILWDATNATNAWVRALPPREVLLAATRRIASVVSRYSGSVIAWDVMNENLHNSYFESVLGANASAVIYQIVRALDPHTPLFLNEYNTLEFPKDLKVIPARYIHKIREIKSFPGNQDMVLRIGLQGHFSSRPNISYIRAAFDVLGASGSPIWLTELDFIKIPTQIEDLEDVMREAFAHPAMEGMIIFGGWKEAACRDECISIVDSTNVPKGCSQMCLIDNNFKNQPIGDMVDNLIFNEWKSNITALTDKDGRFSDKLFHGAYDLTCSHPSLPNPVIKSFNLTKESGPFEFSITLK